MITTQRKAVITGDGSHTFLTENNISYHSMHGALQESLHVFIQQGLEQIFSRFDGPVSILETGFGTGLNAILTYLEAGKAGRDIQYTTIELFPLQENEWSLLNHGKILKEEDIFRQIHEAAWDVPVKIDPHFSLLKINASLESYSPADSFHLIYFDAFAPDDQPELWTQEIFQKLYDSMYPGGILTTYCAKGYVRRNMKSAGFEVERIPGPPGKRQMMRAVKP